jgi:organic anion transporter 4A
VVVSTIEKRYQFSSLAASMIIAVFDMSVTASVVFISYFGHKSHKPRWLGIALIIQGIGAFVFSLPQFIFGKYEVGSGARLRLESCDTGRPFLSSCSAANDIAYGLFILGNILVGIGAAPLFTIGTSFIDDIVHPKFVSLHLGFFYMSAVVGPAIGYGLGGAFLSIYVDPWRSTHLQETDPGWVGAWWLSFIFCGILSVLLSIPFLMYPRNLKDSHLIQEARKLEMAESYKSKYIHEESFLVQLKVFPRHLEKLFRNASYLFVTIGISVLFFSLDGMVAFGPKYIESVYTIPASTASILVGAIGKINCKIDVTIDN